MMSDYPATLPLPDARHVGELDWGLLQTQVKTHRGAQRLSFNSPREDIALVWHMHNDQLLEFSLWAENTAWDWFTMPMVSSHTPTDIMSDQEVRFITDITTRKVGNDWTEVAAGIEIRPAATRVVRASYVSTDLIEAGSPSAPAVDSIDAGDPQAPGEGLVKSRMYDID